MGSEHMGMAAIGVRKQTTNQHSQMADKVIAYFGRVGMRERVCYREGKIVCKVWYHM